MMRGRLQRLQESGFDLSVICGSTGHSDRLAACGLNVIHVPFAREPEPLTDLRCLWAIRRVLVRGRFDIVHSHNPKGTLLGPVAGKLARVPIVTHTVYGLLFNENSGGLYRILAKGAERWCAFWCDYLLFQCREDYEHATAHRWKREGHLHFIGGGIDEHRFNRDSYPGAREITRRRLGFTEDDLVIGMVGRFVAEKGWIEFFHMARHIAAEFERARFLAIAIIDEGQSDALDPSAMVADSGVADKLVLLENQTDMPELYTCMDIAVLPSHREGIPRALSEAGSMGVAMVASDTRGCREVVIHRETGLLFPMKDIDGLTDSIRQLLLDGALRRRLAEAGRDHIHSEHTEGRAHSRLRACYREFIDANAKSVADSNA